MFILRALAGIASVVALVGAAETNQPMDLGSVLGRHPKLSTYYKLIKVRFPVFNSGRHHIKSFRNFLIF